MLHAVLVIQHDFAVSYDLCVPNALIHSPGRVAQSVARPTQE